MMDGVAAALWFTFTAAVIYAAWALARRLFPADHTPAQLVMHALIVVWSWLAVVSFVLGSVGALNAPSLGLGALLVAAGSCVWVSKSSGAGHSLDRPDSSEIPGQRSATAWRILWCGIAGIGGAVVIVRGVAEFPTEWDTLAYHRPLIDHWLQSGSLYAPACWVWQVPGNNELIGLWWAAPFSGDFWVPLMNVPAVLLLALGTFELGRLVGLPPVLRHATVLGTLASTVIFRQLIEAKNDVAVAALFIAGVAYGLRHIRQGRRRDLVMTGLSLGLLAGIKYYALGYVAVAWLGLLVVTRFQSGWSRVLPFATTTAGLILVLAGYWYGRNLLVTGTPLYPLGYAGKDAAAAYMPRSAWKSSIIGNGKIDVLPEYVEDVWKLAGPCQTSAVLALPVSMAWLLISGTFAKTARRSDVGLRIGLAVMLFAAWLNFGITPFTIAADDSDRLDSPYIAVRFSQIPLVLSLFALAIPLADVSRMLYAAKIGARRRPTAARTLPGLFTVSAALSIFFVGAQAAERNAAILLPLAFNLAVLSLLVHAISVRQLIANRRLIALMLAGSAAIFVIASIELSTWWHRGFSKFYDEMYRTKINSLLDKEAVPPSIALTYPLYYPFFGSRRQFHAFSPRDFASMRHLCLYLGANNIDLLLISDNNEAWSRHSGVRAWVRQQPDIFDRVATSRLRFSVYRIEKSRLKEHLTHAHESGTTTPLSGKQGDPR